MRRSSEPEAKPEVVVVVEKWRRVVHVLLWWMQWRTPWAELGHRLNALSGLKRNDKWLKWALKQ